MPGAGCYGHNGADDAAFDAALIALAVPGKTGATEMDPGRRTCLGAVRLSYGLRATCQSGWKWQDHRLVT